MFSIWSTERLLTRRPTGQWFPGYLEDWWECWMITNLTSPILHWCRKYTNNRCLQKLLDILHVINVSSLMFRMRFVISITPERLITTNPAYCSLSDLLMGVYVLERFTSSDYYYIFSSMSLSTLNTWTPRLKIYDHFPRSSEGPRWKVIHSLRGDLLVMPLSHFYILNWTQALHVSVDKHKLLQN